jgi:transitional endoplasmic reticulum ATPase
MSSNIDDNNDNNTKKEIVSLKVAEAEQRDVGRKIARIDPKVAERLNITSGAA